MKLHTQFHLSIEQLHMYVTFVSYCKYAKVDQHFYTTVLSLVEAIVAFSLLYL